MVRFSNPVRKPANHSCLRHVSVMVHKTLTKYYWALDERGLVRERFSPTDALAEDILLI